MGEFLKEIQPQDLLKLGIIPELVGRLPVTATLRSPLDREQMIQILAEPNTALVKHVGSCYDEKRWCWSHPGAGEAVAEPGRWP